MGKYILKRIGYMFIVLVVMSVLLFLIYNLVPNNRAYTDAKADMTAQKTRLRNASEEEKDKMFNDSYLEYQRRYGTDTDNMAVRYLRWVGIMPNYYGTYSGLLQGDFGYSYEFKDDVINVVQEPLKNTIFINIFATIKPKKLNTN